jgi:flagellar basal-body rod protein FlgB
MLTGLFQSSTIPILQEVVSFSQARHAVLAGNIANLDTPGYQARDLSLEDFQARLKEAIEDRDQPPPASGYPVSPGGTVSPGETLSPGESGFAQPLMAEVARSSRSILRHDMGNVDMESQVTEMVKNEMQYNTALTILTDQFKQLQTAIRGTV